MRSKSLSCHCQNKQLIMRKIALSYIMCWERKPAPTLLNVFCHQVHSLHSSAQEDSQGSQLQSQDSNILHLTSSHRLSPSPTGKNHVAVRVSNEVLIDMFINKINIYCM